ncbi:basic-leucine zipper transcription factor, partial [Mucor lusitanicus CBS 277.49]
EDKRRRNTAASARFRVKKKMREQAMEQSVREMTQKSDKLQDRVNNLESEIKYLRSLLL